MTLSASKRQEAVKVYDVPVPSGRVRHLVVLSWTLTTNLALRPKTPEISAAIT